MTGGPPHHGLSRVTLRMSNSALDQNPMLDTLRGRHKKRCNDPNEN